MIIPEVLLDFFDEFSGRIDVLSMSLVWLVLACLFLPTLQRALVLTRSHHTLDPNLVWLSLIPIFGIGWQFLVLARVTDGIRGYFLARGESVDDAGWPIALGYCICSLGALVCCCIPCFNFVSYAAAVVLMVLYWVRVSDYVRRIEATVA